MRESPHLFGLVSCLLAVALSVSAQTNTVTDEVDSQQPVVIRLPAQPRRPAFAKSPQPPRAISQTPASSTGARTVEQSPVAQRNGAPVAQQPRAQVPPQQQQTQIQAQLQQQLTQPQSEPQPQTPQLAPVSVQQPILPPVAGASFAPRDMVTLAPPPPVNIPPDVQNQLIKFFGLDSFGIPGLTGNHPAGFAGAVKELRAAGIPVQGLPVEHLGGQPIHAPQSEVLVQANSNFANELNNLMQEGTAPFQASGSSAGAGSTLPDAKPGENGLIGLLSSSIRKLVKDSGVAEALSQGIPSVLGTGGETGANGAHAGTHGFQNDADAESAALAAGGSSAIRRQQSPAERALSGFASALGGGAGNGNKPTHAGLPRIPGIPLLPGGIPRNSQGQIDVVSLIGSITRRVSNGTTLADVLPPEQLQTLADNVTDALLPATPEDFQLSKFMGRWFEGINSPRATEQRCVVHHYGGLTKNDKTATFTALKIYREGSEFGPVRYSIGYAFRAGNKDAMLQLHSSENSDAQPFWVYKLGPEGTDPFGNKQYEYAIVSNWVKYPVTVLVRDPDTFKSKYEVEVLRWLEDQGFINGFVRAFNLLQPAGYSSCQYAENTFELFGKK